MKLEMLESCNDYNEKCFDLALHEGDDYVFVGEIARKKHAEYIIKACNMYPELVETLKELREAEWMMTNDWGGDRESIINKVDAILAKAKEDI